MDTIKEEYRLTFKDRKIAFIEPHVDFATNPTLLSLSEELLKLGASVDVYSPGFGNYPPLNGLIPFHPFPYRFRVWNYGIKRTWNNIKGYFSNASWKAHSLLRSTGYDFIFGIDTEGVIAAWSFSRKHRVPFAYISFEIFFRDEFKRVSEHREKSDEIIASRHADLVIIQDHFRAALLAKENTIPKEKFAYLPVAPRDSMVKKSSYLRDKYGIPSNKTIVIHAGSFNNWTCAEELIESLNSWPKSAVLVLHTRNDPRNRNPYINRMRKEHFENLVLSTTPLGIDEYEKMIASSDIGLVLYKQIPQASKSLNKNLATIGLASGKLSYYMKYGLPVISFQQETYSGFLKDYEFGIDMKAFSEIPKAIQRIESNYMRFSNQSRKFFVERLDFSLYWPKIVQKVCSILKNPKQNR